MTHLREQQQNIYIPAVNRLTDSTFCWNNHFTITLWKKHIQHQNNVKHQLVEVVLLTYYGFNIEISTIFNLYVKPTEGYIFKIKEVLIKGGAETRRPMKFVVGVTLRHRPRKTNLRCHLQLHQEHRRRSERRKKTKEMAKQTNFGVVRLAFLAVFSLIVSFVPVGASADSTKTVDLDIRPGGVVHTFTEGIVSDWMNYCLCFRD